MPLSREQQQAVVAHAADFQARMVGSEGGGPRDEFFLPTVGGAARSLLDGRKRAMSEAHRDEGGAGGASHAARAKGESKLSAGRPRTTLQQQQQASEGRYERTTG